MAINNVEWLNNNMHRNYPLKDDCSAISSTGMYMPTSFLVDMNISISDTGDDSANLRFFLSRIINTGINAKVVISYQSPAGLFFECLISEDIPLSLTASDSIEDRLFNLVPTSTIPDEYIDVFNTAKANLIVGTCSDIYISGGMEFDYDTAVISPMTINIVSINKTSTIDSVTFLDYNGNEIGTVTDDFVIQAGNGIDISIDYSGEFPVVSIHRVEDSSTSIMSVDDIVNAVKTSLGNPITSINGVTPINGNVTILGQSCTTITSGAGSISISNPCSQPCCTGNEAENNAAINTLNDYATRLIQYFESMSTIVTSLQSRLSALIAYRK